MTWDARMRCRWPGAPPRDDHQWRLVAATALVCAYIALVLWAVQRMPQVMDDLSAREITDAQAMLSGAHVWGIVRYNKMPLGTAYLMVPLLWLGWPVRWAALGMWCAAGGSALWATLRHSDAVWWPAVCGGFMLLLWQPGIGQWITAPQESFCLSLVYAALAVGILGRLRSLGLLGFIVGWLTYESLFAVVLAVTVTALARGESLPVTGLRTAVFVGGFAVAVMVHCGQLALYQGAAMTVQDFGGDLRDRLTIAGGIAVRVRWVPILLRDYAAVAFTPLWSSLAGLWAVGAWYGVSLLGSPRWGRVLCVVALCGAAVPFWFFVAPNYVVPHLHLFPRIILFGPLMCMISAVPIAASAKGTA